MYDIVVVGAGLHALTFLCTYLESTPMSKDLIDASGGRTRSNLSERAMRKKLLGRMRMTKAQIWKGRKIVVVDKFGTWLENWKKQFEVLKIENLRSNAALHPDPFDPEMLFEFARMRGWATDDAFNEITGVSRGKRFTGPFQLPRTEVFNAFCEFLIDSYKLTDAIVAGEVTSIVHCSDDRFPQEGPDRKILSHFQVRLSDGRRLDSSKVIVAIGHTNLPKYPDWVERDVWPSHSILHAWELVHRSMSVELREADTVAVIGGGLTSIQLTQAAIDRGCQRVYLISRRHLNVRQFDSGLSWSGRLRQDKLSQFWNEPSMDQRLRMIKEARQGGTITVSARDSLTSMEADGTCVLMEGVEVWDAEWTGSSYRLDLSNDELIEVNKIWLATGSSIDVHKEKLFASIIREYPVASFAGYPLLSDDLKWHPDLELYIIGGYASLTLGPDGVNLAGARRSAFRLREHLCD